MTEDRDLWLAIRQGLLLIVGAIERRFGISPTTKELRAKVKER